jgi:hypothetical protein
LSRRLAPLSNQEQSQIKPLRRPTSNGRLLLDLKNDVHNRIGKIGFSGRMKLA